MTEKKYHHGNLRSTLIETGIKMINDVGLSGFSLRKLAIECGVSRSAPYSHFKDKEDMILVMQDYVTEKFVSRLNEAMKVNGSKDTLLTNIGKTYVQFFIDNPNYYSFLFNESDIKIIFSADRDKIAHYKDLVDDPNSLVFLMDKLDIPESLQMQNILALWSLVHGLAGIITMEGVTFEGNWELMIEKILSENFQLVIK